MPEPAEAVSKFVNKIIMRFELCGGDNYKKVCDPQIMTTLAVVVVKNKTIIVTIMMMVTKNKMTIIVSKMTMMMREGMSAGFL